MYFFICIFKQFNRIWCKLIKFIRMSSNVYFCLDFTMIVLKSCPFDEWDVLWMRYVYQDTAALNSNVIDNRFNQIWRLELANVSFNGWMLNFEIVCIKSRTKYGLIKFKKILHLFSFEGLVFCDMQNEMKSMNRKFISYPIRNECFENKCLLVMRTIILFVSVKDMLYQRMGKCYKLLAQRNDIYCFQEYSAYFNIIWFSLNKSSNGICFE